MTTELPLTSDIRAIYADAEDFDFSTSANYANRGENFDAWLEATVEAAKAQGRAEGGLAAANEICLKLEETISHTPVFDKRDSGVQSGLDAALKIASDVAQENLDKIPETQL